MPKRREWRGQPLTRLCAVLRERWDKLAKEHPDRFKVVYSLDKPPYFWRGEKGYITKEMIQKYSPENAKDVKVSTVSASRDSG